MISDHHTSTSNNHDDDDDNDDEDDKAKEGMHTEGKAVNAVTIVQCIVNCIAVYVFSEQRGTNSRSVVSSS